MRTFIALDFPREVINYIREIQNLLKKRNLFEGKFTEPENLHLTLKFLGEIDEKRLKEVKERLKGVRFNEFDGSLDKIGVFSKKFIKIIWIKLEGAEQLQKQIDECLRDLFGLENRFMGHITIARVKNVKDKKALLDYIQNMKIKKLKFKINRFYLKNSELRSEGPVYKDIGVYSAEKI